MKIHLLGNRTIAGYTTFGSVYDNGEVSGDSHFTLKNPGKSRGWGNHPDA